MNDSPQKPVSPTIDKDVEKKLTTFKAFGIEFSGPSWVAIVFIGFCLIFIYMSFHAPPLPSTKDTPNNDFNSKVNLTPSYPPQNSLTPSSPLAPQKPSSANDIKNWQDQPIGK